ncbi:MAG: amino acid carrier protein [Parachlamydiaceae bacterium]
MLDTLFNSLNLFEDFLWGYLGFPALLALGVYFTLKTGFIQVRGFPHVIRTFLSLVGKKDEACRGVHPLKAFFACVGGCVGVGNIVSICTGVQIGGPGALFWIWITAIFGMMIKYAEVYLGIRYRVANKEGGYNGGPMYFLQHAFPWKWLSTASAVLLAIYGVEVFQFSTVVQSVTSNWNLPIFPVTALLLGLILYAGSGGVNRVGTISSAIIPIFVVLYLGMGAWVLFSHISYLPEVLGNVFRYAFTGHGALGGFVGSTLMMTISQGVRRGCYTGDIAVGYASVINSETCLQKPQKQASLEFLGVVLDTFVICTTSVVLILLTDVWHQPLDVSVLVQTALGQHFPYMHLFMPFFLFLLGYSTINAYFIAGLKCIDYLAPNHGRKLFYPLASLALLGSAYIDVVQAQSIMAIVGGLLLVLNVAGIYRMRKEVSFDFLHDDEPESESVCKAD